MDRLADTDPRAADRIWLWRAAAIAVALAGSVLFGAVYGSLAEGYQKLSGVSLGAAELAQVAVELEDTFQEITEAEEQAFVASLPAAVREAYSRLVGDAAVRGLQAALTVMGAGVVLMGLLALLLPGSRPARARPGEEIGS